MAPVRETPRRDIAAVALQAAKPLPVRSLSPTCASCGPTPTLPGPCGVRRGPPTAATQPCTGDGGLPTVAPTTAPTCTVRKGAHPEVGTTTPSGLARASRGRVARDPLHTPPPLPSRRACHHRALSTSHAHACKRHQQTGARATTAPPPSAYYRWAGGARAPPLRLTAHVPLTHTHSVRPYLPSGSDAHSQAQLSP